MSVATLLVALLVFACTYYTYRHEAINRLIQAGWLLRTSIGQNLNRRTLSARLYVHSP
jgi:hypothetical protein